jgi:hypothetical protein
MQRDQQYIIAAVKIQRLFRRNYDMSWLSITHNLIKERRHIYFSTLAQSSLTTLINDHIYRGRSFLSDGEQNENFHYKLQHNPFLFENPGINLKSEEFQRFIHQQVVIFPKQFMELFDLQVIGLALRQPICHINHLAIHESTLFADVARPGHVRNRTVDPPNPSASDNSLAGFDPLRYFFESLIKSISLKSVYVLGGKWSMAAITYLFQLIQVDNPRIQEIYIERMETAKQHHNLLGQCASRLLKDYFNYSIPGIRIISMHACYLRDEQLIAIAEGLLVNTSLEKLVLSLNMITDVGFNAVFEAIQHNRKTNLKYLDFQHNFIRCANKTKSLLMNYRFPKVSKDILEINLLDNFILEPFDPIEFAVETKLEPQLIIHYNPELLVKLRKRKDRRLRELQRELLKPSTARQLNRTVSPATFENGGLFGALPNAPAHRSYNGGNVYFETDEFLQSLDKRIRAKTSHRHGLPNKELLQTYNLSSSTTHLPPIGRQQSLDSHSSSGTAKGRKRKDKDARSKQLTHSHSSHSLAGNSFSSERSFVSIYSQEQGVKFRSMSSTLSETSRSMR